jgi:hypothetical protein
VFSVERGSHRETFEIIGLLGLLILVFEETKLKRRSSSGFLFCGKIEIWHSIYGSHMLTEIWHHYFLLSMRGREASLRGRERERERRLKKKKNPLVCYSELSCESSL